MVLRQRLTAMGWVGLVFFFLGPIIFIQRFFLALLGVVMVGLLPDIIIAITVGCGFLSLPMLLLGREWVIIKE